MRRAVTRRGFLTLAGATASLAALGQVHAAPAPARSDGATRFFSPEETEILTQVVERIVDSGEAEAPRVRETATVATVDRLCTGLDPALTGALPWLLRVVEWGPLVFDRRASRFTRLPDATKDASLHGWMTSRFAVRRMGFQALRNLAFLGWYTQPETWRLVGYRGPLLRRGKGAS